jgi:hypothetical protein
MADGDVWQAINTTNDEFGHPLIWLSGDLDLIIWLWSMNQSPMNQSMTRCADDPTTKLTVDTCR